MQHWLTLSWRRPLSYRNQSIDFYMITASVLKGLKENFSKFLEELLIGIYQSVFNIITFDFASDFQAVFLEILFFTTQRKMLRKLFYRESFPENVYDVVYSGKVASVQCTDSRSTLNRLHHRFFLEYVPKTNWLKKIISEKSLRCSSFLLRTFWRNAKNYDVFEGKPLRWKLLFSLIAGLKPLPASLSNTDFLTEVSAYDFSKSLCWKFQKNFCEISLPFLF